MICHCPGLLWSREAAQVGISSHQPLWCHLLLPIRLQWCRQYDSCSGHLDFKLWKANSHWYWLDDDCRSLNRCYYTYHHHQPNPNYTARGESQLGLWSSMAFTHKVPDFWLGNMNLVGSSKWLLLHFEGFLATWIAGLFRDSSSPQNQPDNLEWYEKAEHL